MADVLWGLADDLCARALPGLLVDEILQILSLLSIVCMPGGPAEFLPTFISVRRVQSPVVVAPDLPNGLKRPCPTLVALASSRDAGFRSVNWRAPATMTFW